MVALMAAVGCFTASAQDDARTLERNAYNEARRLGTVESWEIFINNYPNSYYIEQARKQRDDAMVKSFCRPETTLDQFTAYIDGDGAHEPRIRTFYANLVNNPTHSHRIEHFDVGFNGCTGTVSEVVTFPNGKQRKNTFVFNDQGLLTRSSIVGAKGKANTVNYAYGYDNLHGYALKEVSRKGKTITFAPIYNDAEQLVTLKADDGGRQQLNYSESGALTSRVITDAKGNTRTLVYRDGYVIREERDGKVFRYLYDYDSATHKKYLIAIREMDGENIVHERKFAYRIDSHGRYTRIEISLDDKPQMTLTRAYSN